MSNGHVGAINYILSSGDRRKLEEALKLGMTACLGSRATGLPLLPGWADKATASIDAALSLLAGLPKVPDADAKDARRYRWLRDVSVPPHNFYISVPEEFHGVRYSEEQVDAYIDAAMKEHPQP